MNYWPATIQPHAQSPTMKAGEAGGAQPAHCMPEAHAPATHGMLAMTQPRVQCPTMQAGEAGGAQPAHCMPAEHAPATHGMLAMTQPRAQCPTMQAGEAGGAQPAHCMPEAHAPATHDMLAMTQPRAQCPTMQAGEAGGAQPAHCMPEAHAPATHGMLAMMQPRVQCPTMQAGEAGGAQPAHCMPAEHAPATHGMLAMTQPRAQCPTMQAGEAGGAQPAHCMPEAHAPATHDMLAMTQPRAQCPTMQAGEAGGAQPAHCMPEAHAPATHGMLAMMQPRVQCPTMQAGEAGGAQPAHCMPAEHAPATHGMLAVTQPCAQCPTMQAGEAGGAQPAHCMPAAHAPATHGMLAMMQPRVQYPTMQAGEAGGAQPAHCMPEAHAPATHGMLAMTQPRAQCPTMQAGEAGGAQPAHCMPAAHAPATHGMLAMMQPRVQYPTMQAREARGAHHVPAEHAPAIHAGTMPPYEAQPAKEQTGMLHSCMLMDTSRDVGTIADKTYKTLVPCKSSVIVHHYNTTLQRHTLYRITILDKQRRPTNVIPMDHLKTAIQWLGILSTSYCAMAITYIAWLLLACGDVEANPGPNTHYVQQVGSSTCQADSLNNIAGRKWVSIDDIDTFYAQRLTQLNTPDELKAWQMARGAGGYDDGVIDLYLTSKYGLMATSVADLRRPQDWTKHNLNSLAQRHETTAFLCKRLGHSMAMTSLNGKWSLKDSLDPAPTPLARIAMSTKQTHHQLFIITPTHTTRTSAQLALCHTKKINHIISHTNHNTGPPVPIYMEAQHKCFCLVHAINMAMGRPLINPHEAGGAQPAHCMPEAHAPATHDMLAMTQPRAQCPTMQAGEAGGAQPAHCMPEAHAPATHGMLAMMQPRVQCPTMQAGEAGGAQPAHCMPAEHAPATHGMLAVTQPCAQCPTMQAGEAGGAQPAHCMPAAHAPATHGMLAMMQPRVQYPTMQAGEAGGAQPAHCMPEAHAPATHGMLAMTQPRAQCPTMQAGEAGGAQPAHCMPAAHAPATHGMLAMMQPRVQYPTMQAREARGAHHVPAEHAPAIHAGTMPPYEAQPAKEQTGMLHSCMLMDTSRDVGTIADKTYKTLVPCKSSVIVHHYNTTLQRHTLYRITILDKQRRPTNVIPMDHLKTAIQWLGILSTSYCAMAITYIAWLLLACGDVEANPGPNTHYVQQVGSSTCQADSLNNIAGRRWVSIDDIDTFYAQRLTQLNTPDELKAWQMARGAGGYDDGVIDLYLTSKYGLMATSVADLRRPQDWTKHNLNSLAQRHETTAFLCKRLGHSMAMTSLNGKWSLKDSLDPAPTPLARIAMSTKQTHHQLFIITPTHTTRTSAQLALCHTKKINHIISHTNHNTGPPVPIYMEAQHKCFCLVHAINMAMGRPLINPHDVLTHCSHLATHLQDLASRARGENKHIPLPDRTPHIYDQDGNFNIHSMNHYLHHNYKTLHLATQELPHDNITRATLSTLMGNEDNHISNAAILINRNHATTLRYLDNTWYWLDSQATHARRLLTTADWKELQGGLILLKQGMQHKNLIEPIFWLADPLEQATTTQLEQHYQRPDPIDLSGHDDQPPAIPPPAATPPSLATSNNDLKRNHTPAEADPPARSRHREAATAKEDAPPPPPPNTKREAKHQDRP
ncbi:hypothetical protein QJQ45_016400 [Haematococcus lacustris]|nr:hypothetical protein QJQ45_016400 [Haematococcus lacustris]